MVSLRPYISVFKFVAIFGGLYLVLSSLYGVYLQQEYSARWYPDPVTSIVADQVSWCLNMLGRTSTVANTAGLPSVNLYVDSTAVYRVIEGCNAVSVMILFASFVFAFAKAWKKTFLYVLMGLLLIYIINVLRLIILAIVYADFKEYATFAHDVMFPAIIYGTVILLWLLWIRQPEKDASK